MSLNLSHRLVKFGKRAGRIKTDEFNRWEKEFLVYLAEYNELRPVLLEGYDARKHSIQLEMFVYLNKDKYFAKVKGGFKRISARSGDVSNMIKTSEDQIFSWLGLDDSLVSRIIAEKIPTDDAGTMVFRITLVEIPELFEVQAQSI